MNICLHYKKMGDDLNIKEKEEQEQEQEKLKKEAEIRNEKYENNYFEKKIKCDMTAFNYETKGEYISYFEKMLIANDEVK